MAPPLIQLKDIALTFGGTPLLDGVELSVSAGERVCLVGRNGSGKSTLLKILAGLETPDQGTRSLRGGIRVGYVAQDPVFPPGGTVDDVMAAALTGVEDADRPVRIAHALGRAGLTSPHATIESLSGGGKKRLAIAQALVAEPDVLLMDEPTNHLDLEGILWLEALLRERARAFLVVSHDRWFLEHVVTRMLELNRAYPKGLFEADGTYSEFLGRREDFMHGRPRGRVARQPVRREIEWLRRGAKARSTKAKGRIKEAGRLIEELEQAGTAGDGTRVSSSRPHSDAPASCWSRGASRNRSGADGSSAIWIDDHAGTRVGLSSRTAAADDAPAPAPGSCPPTPARSSAPTVSASCASIRRARDSTHAEPAADARAGGRLGEFPGRNVHGAAWAKRFLFRPSSSTWPWASLGRERPASIARLMRGRRLLILDEPTKRLDIPRSKCSRTASSIFRAGSSRHPRSLHARSGVTMILASRRGGTARRRGYAQWEAA